MYANVVGSGSPDAWVETPIVEALYLNCILDRGCKSAYLSFLTLSTPLTLNSLARYLAHNPPFYLSKKTSIPLNPSLTGNSALWSR